MDISFMIEQLVSTLSLSEKEMKQPVILRRHESVFYLLLNTKANSFTHSFVRSIGQCLDEVEAVEGPVCLVTVSLSKLFSGGLDLKYTSNLAPQDQRFFVLEFINLLGRISVLPFPTIALVKGAAVAGGCMFSFAHDYIFVAETGLFACNEVDIGLPLPPGMMAIIRKKNQLHHPLREMTLFGKKFTAAEALEARMIDRILPSASALKDTHAFAKEKSSYGENRTNFKKLKLELHKEVVDCCFNRQHAIGVVGEATFPLLPKL